MVATEARDKILEALGLDVRKSTTDVLLPAIGVFAAGLLVGAGLGVLFAPKAGRELRQDIGNKLGHIRNRAEDLVEESHH